MQFLKTASLIILVFLTMLACQSEVPDTEKLFLNNFLPYPNVLIKLNKDTTSLDPRKQFFLAYRDKNYAKSLKISESMPALMPDDPMQLYRAVCLMAIGEYERALPSLKNLAATQGDFQEAANWYWSLVLLKLGDIEGCKKQLSSLKNTSTYIRNEASVLNSKLQ